MNIFFAFFVMNKKTEALKKMRYPKSIMPYTGLYAYISLFNNAILRFFLFLTLQFSFFLFEILPQVVFVLYVKPFWIMKTSMMKLTQTRNVRNTEKWYDHIFIDLNCYTVQCVYLFFVLVFIQPCESFVRQDVFWPIKVKYTI